MEPKLIYRQFFTCPSWKGKFKEPLQKWTAAKKKVLQPLICILKYMVRWSSRRGRWREWDSLQLPTRLIGRAKIKPFCIRYTLFSKRARVTQTHAAIYRPTVCDTTPYGSFRFAAFFFHFIFVGTYTQYPHIALICPCVSIQTFFIFVLYVQHIKF